MRQQYKTFKTRIFPLQQHRALLHSVRLDPFLPCSYAPICTSSRVVQCISPPFFDSNQTFSDHWMIYKRDHRYNSSSSKSRKIKWPPKSKRGVFVSVTARISRKISSSGEQKPDLGKTNYWIWASNIIDLFLQVFFLSFQYLVFFVVTRPPVKRHYMSMTGYIIIHCCWHVSHEKNSLFALKPEKSFPKRPHMCVKRVHSVKEGHPTKGKHTGISRIKSTPNFSEWTSCGMKWDNWY